MSEISLLVAMAGLLVVIGGIAGVLAGLLGGWWRDRIGTGVFFMRFKRLDMTALN